MRNDREFVWFYLTYQELQIFRMVNYMHLILCPDTALWHPIPTDMGYANENWRTKYPFNCFTYNSGIFHNETNWEYFLIMRHEKCNFLRFVKKIDGGELPQNYFSLHKNYNKEVKSKRKI